MSISTSKAPSMTCGTIDGADLLHQICEFIRLHVKLSDDAVPLVAMWIVWTWLSERSYFQPRLAIVSPEPGCGKTTLLRLLELLTRDPETSSSITPAALFRTIADFRPTILMDEADTFLDGNEGMRGIINAGFERPGAVTRCVGDAHTPKKFSVASPFAIAAIGTLPNTIMDRSIVIEMQRKEVGVKLASLRVDRPTKATVLCEKITAWVKEIEEKFEGHEPEHMPELSSDRAADKLRPLIAVADFAGDHWPTIARSAARDHDQRSQINRTQTEGVQLLQDIKAIGTERKASAIWSADLISELLNIEESPWNECRPAGRALNARHLARLLKPYDIRSKTVRFGTATAKGYEFEDFQDAFARYLPTSSE